MTFPEAMTSIIAGASVRRAAWGVRRMLRLAPTPWNGGETESLLVMDRMNKGDVPPYPYTPTGADVRGSDWSIINGGNTTP